jgi:hypothetical protein
MSGMGTSTQSSTEQSQTSYPQWTQDAQANTFQVGRGQLENFLRNPQYSVAGTTTDMLKGYDLARETAQQAYTAPQLRAPGSPNLTASTIDASMNPYLKAVGDTTLDNMRREYGNTDAALASKYAAGNMMGGSGEAIARGQAARGYNQNVASTIAQIQSAGFDKAREAALANMQAENAMKTTGADYGLKATQVDDTLRTTNQARQMSALQQLLQGGQMQQQQNQQVLDVPWTALERLFGITPKQMNSQTNSQKESESTASPASTFGSIASGLGSLGIKFSDARMKTDIRRLGTLPNGLGVYDYAWRADGAREIGLIAQEVQRVRPDAVIEAPNGYLMVDYGKAVGGA